MESQRRCQRTCHGFASAAVYTKAHGVLVDAKLLVARVRAQTRAVIVRPWTRTAVSVAACELIKSHSLAAAGAAAGDHAWQPAPIQPIVH